MGGLGGALLLLLLMRSKRVARFGVLGHGYSCREVDMASMCRIEDSDGLEWLCLDAVTFHKGGLWRT